MKRLLTLLFGVLLLSSMGICAELAPRDWTINGQAMNQTIFTATFMKYDGKLVYLKMPDGFIRKVPAGQISDQGLWYIQSVLSQIPEKISAPEVKPDQKLLVDLYASDLALGPIKEWANKGALGGSFHALRTPLTVKEINGKKAVNFYFGPWAVPLEFQAMVSDFQAPKSITENGPFTISMWVYSPSPLGIDSTRESVLSWHALDGDRDGSDFGYGTNGRYAVEARSNDPKVSRGSGAYSGPLGSYFFDQSIFPAMNQWHHFAYVYTGAGDGKFGIQAAGKFRIYVDDKLVVENTISSPSTPSGDKLMFLGCNWGAGRGGSNARPQQFFTGAIAKLQIYSGAMGVDEIAKLYGSPVSNKPIEITKPTPFVIPAEKLTLVDYFTPEPDGLAAEPFPKAIRQNGEFGKYMEGWGQPVVGRDRCPDEAMRRCAYMMGKTMAKRPDIRDVIEGLDCAARLDDVGPPWLGWTELTTACYGQARSFYADPGFYWGSCIMVHEMGHQFHMWGAEQIENDFRDRLYAVFWQNKLDGLWSGDYGGLNMWEYMACAISAYCSDGTEDDIVSRREQLRQNDPRMFYFLQSYWPGDTLIELLPSTGLKTDDKGKVKSWANNGGLEFWGKFGLKKYPWTTGAFLPKGSPTLGTTAGVACVKFSGKDALVWDKVTTESLMQNKAWSVELWAYRDKPAAGDEVLLSWGPAGHGPWFTWGKAPHAGEFGEGVTCWAQKPAQGKWHHIVYVFTGGGLENGNGALKVYVDGKIDSQGEYKLDFPAGQSVIVGGVLEGGVVKSGFNGSIAHVRVYDYDLGDLQLKDHYAAEKSYYQREKLNVAGALLVDLDARQLATCPEYQSRPRYPASTGKTWLRSWANRGTLGGKMSNDVTEPQSSYPHLKTVDGINAVVFGSDPQANEAKAGHIDRLVSMFQPPYYEPSYQITKSASLTFETWVYRSANDQDGQIFRWGPVALGSKSIKPGVWTNVAIVCNSAKKSALVYIDGLKTQEVAFAAIPANERLQIGASWDGSAWAYPFKGAIAQIRVHAGELTSAQIASNIASSGLNLASNPSPANGKRVAVERIPKLSWNPGIKPGKLSEVYFSDHPSKLAKVGSFKSGEFAPKLAPGKTYFWRVGSGPIWSFSTYKGCVVDIDASKLADGKLSEWKNNGSAGGKFVSGSFGSLPAPSVEKWDGHKGVSFFGNKYLTASFPTPKELNGSAPFSVSLKVYNTNLLDKATMLSWGDARTPVEFNYGRDADTSAFTNANNKISYGGTVTKPDIAHYNAPMLTFWHNIVYTYADGTLKIYVNGILNQEKKVDLNISDSGRISVGAFVDSNGNRQSPFAGFISDVAIYGYALSQDEVNSIYDGSGAKPDASKMLVKLTSVNLPDGKLTSWKNEGTLGGEFKLLPEKPTQPTVEIIAGRKAVTFDGAQTFMSSDIKTPACVTGINPVTIEMWAYNPSIIGSETVFSLAPREAFKTIYLEYTINRALEMCYSGGPEYSTGAINTLWDPRNMGWKDGKFPEVGKWHHIAFVYDGKHQGSAKLYVDGELSTSRGFYTLCTNAGMPMFLGTAWNTDRGTEDMFGGSLASVKVFDYAKTAGEVKKDYQGK